LGGASDFINNFSLVYLFGAGYTLVQIFRNWAAFWDNVLTGRDRQLAGGAAFFLLVPMGVLLHEFGHMLAAWSTGSQVLGLHYFLFWGYVEYIPASQSALLNWYVALAGNFVSFALGVGCIVAAVRLQALKPIVRVMLMQLGVLEFVQTLIAYPLMSLDPGFVGDWNSIYSFKAPVASGITLAVHIVSLVAFIYFIRANETAKLLLNGPGKPAPQPTEPIP